MHALPLRFAAERSVQYICDFLGGQLFIGGQSFWGANNFKGSKFFWGVNNFGWSTNFGGQKFGWVKKMLGSNFVGGQYFFEGQNL